MRQHTSACVCIRQHPSASVSMRSASIRQHTGAYVSIRQLTSPDGSIRQRFLSFCFVTSAHVRTRQHTSAYVSLCRRSPAYVSRRQHTYQQTSAYVSIRQRSLVLFSRGNIHFLCLPFSHSRQLAYTDVCWRFPDSSISKTVLDKNFLFSSMFAFLFLVPG
jgi:hypothetical protein